MTRLQAVSRVLNEIRALQKDEAYNRRTILAMLEDKIKFLLSQKLGERGLYRESELYSHLRCFELEPDDIISCPLIEFRRCRTLMKSKHKLPELVDSKYFNNILSVTAIDGISLFQPISARDYINLQKRKYAKITRPVYIVSDGYLYIPDMDVEAVNLTLLTLRVEEIAEKSECSKEDCCKSYWDYPLINSDKLTESAIKDTIQECLSTFRSIPIDENPNKDSNIKSATIQ